MMEEQRFRQLSESALEDLKQKLFAAEDSGLFEVEEQNGVLNLVFEEPPAKFVLTPNAPVQQIWISALSTSFKLDWDESKQEFVLPKSGEGIVKLVARLIEEQAGEPVEL